MSEMTSSARKVQFHVLLSRCPFHDPAALRSVITALVESAPLHAAVDPTAAATVASRDASLPVGPTSDPCRLAVVDAILGAMPQLEEFVVCVHGAMDAVAEEKRDRSPMADSTSSDDDERRGEPPLGRKSGAERPSFAAAFSQDGTLLGYGDARSFVEPLHGWLLV